MSEIEQQSQKHSLAASALSSLSNVAASSSPSSLRPGPGLSSLPQLSNHSTAATSSRPYLPSPTTAATSSPPSSSSQQTQLPSPLSLHDQSKYPPTSQNFSRTSLSPSTAAPPLPPPLQTTKSSPTYSANSLNGSSKDQHAQSQYSLPKPQTSIGTSLNSSDTVTNGSSDSKKLQQQHSSSANFSLPVPPKEEPSEIIIYPMDSGIIRCICGFSDDDGFTIQCENCNVWQHAVCVNIHNSNEVPDVYLCDICGKHTYDVSAARRLQLQRKRAADNAAAALAAVNTASGLNIAQLNDSQSSKNSKRKRSTGDEERESKREKTERGTSNPNNQSPQEPASRRGSPSATVAGSASNTNTSNEKDKPSTSGAVSTRRGRSKRLTLQPLEELCDNDNEPEKKFTLSQMYQSYFVSIRQNRFSNPTTHKYVQSLASLDSSKLDDTTSYLNTSEYHTIDLPDITVKLTSDHPKQKFSGFSRFGLFVDSAISRDRFIIEYVGLVMMKEEYKCTPINQYRHFGCPKPGVMFHATLPICIDARQVGSRARFIRRSCRPNCKVSTVIVDDKDVIFVVFALEPIKPGTELTVAWEWDESHPVQKLLTDVPMEQLSKEERTFLVHSAEYIHQRGSECACNLAQSECLIGRMKKALGNPSRVTRTSTKTRRGGMLDGTNSLLTEDSDNPSSRGTGSQDSDDTPMISFYSKREARKLQSAMALFDKLTNQSPTTKKRKNDLSDTESRDDDMQTPNEDDPVSVDSDATRPNIFKSKETSTDLQSSEPLKSPAIYSEKSVQTNPLVVPLRKSIPNESGKSSMQLAPPVPAVSSLFPAKQRVFRNFLLKQRVSSASSIDRSRVKSLTDTSAASNNDSSKHSIIASQILGRQLPAIIEPPPQDLKRRSNGFRQPSISGPTNLTFQRPSTSSSSSHHLTFSRSPSASNILGVTASQKYSSTSSPTANHHHSKNEDIANGGGSLSSSQPQVNGFSSQSSTPSATPGATPPRSRSISGPDRSPSYDYYSGTGAGSHYPPPFGSSSSRHVTRSGTPTPTPSPAQTPLHEMSSPPPLQQQSSRPPSSSLHGSNDRSAGKSHHHHGHHHIHGNHHQQTSHAGANGISGSSDKPKRGSDASDVSAPLPASLPTGPASATLQASSASSVAAATPSSVPSSQTQPAASTASAQPSSAPSAKPPIKKKLSFADYMKKKSSAPANKSAASAPPTSTDPK